MAVDSVLVNARAYLKNVIVDCNIAVDDVRIVKIGKEAHMPRADTTINLKGQLVLPGLIDIHVHLRDEGKAYKEDFFTGTAAAAAGGFTTVIDMPNNEPVTMSAVTLRNRMRSAESRILTDVGFRSEFPTNEKETGEIVREGALGFKLFMTDQIGGVDPDDSQALSDAFQTAAKFKVAVCVHAEDGPMLKKAEETLRHCRRNDVSAFGRAHSEEVERKAIDRMLAIASRSGVRLHFCHVSTQKGLQAIVEARKLGVSVSCEATPHHLLLSFDDLRRIGMLGVTVPPVREKRHASALWEGVRNGWIDAIASDHAPHALKEKETDSVWTAKAGIPGLETTLPLLLTEVNDRRLTIGDIVTLMAEKPAHLLGLRTKGCLKELCLADFTVVDLQSTFRIDAGKFLSKAKYSPFEGRIVKGRPTMTFVGGRLVMEDGVTVAKAGTGHIIRREKDL